MESQLQRTHGYNYHDLHNAPALHSVAEDEGEHHHEKKSVLKKVKAKAKKIKDTLKKHGHGHDHEHDHHPEDQDEDEEDEDEDEDEEMIEDPEVHGAPIYESAAVRSAAPGQGVNLEKPSAVGEDRYGSKSTDQVVPRPIVQGQRQYSGESGNNLGRPTAMEVDHARQENNASLPRGVHGTSVLHPSSTDKNVEKMQKQDTGIGNLEDIKGDPNYVRPGTIPADSNYETKVTDPTGEGGEAEMNPLIRSLGKMTVSDETVPRPEAQSEQSGYTGSHDQFAPQSFPTAGEFATEPLTTSSSQGGRESTPKNYDPSKPEELPRDTLTGKSSDGSGYVEKISTATAAFADKAITAKNVVASKLGFGGTEGVKGQETGEGKEAAKSASPTEYADKVAAAVTEKLALIHEKVADAGSSVMSKGKASTNTGKDERPEIRSQGDQSKVADKGVSVTEYLAEKFKPSEEDKALSEVISESLRKKKEESGKKRESKPMGKVTESEEVTKRLGTGKENEREENNAIAAGSESTGKGVVDRIKDAVCLWVGKANQGQHSQGSPGSVGGDRSPATGEVRQPESASTVERRLEE